MPNSNLSTNHDLHDHVLTWLRANGINPDNIPPDAHVTIVGDQLTTDMHVLNEDGKKQFTIDQMALARTTQTYTIAIPPPVDVADWLLPGCPTCGR